MTALTLLSLLELSTGHLSAATRAWLDAGAYPRRAPWGPSLLIRDKGWLISTHHVEPDSRGDYEEEHPRTLPPDLGLCLRVARANNCAWVLFDMDADPCEALPWYEDTNAIARALIEGGPGKASDLWLPGIPRTGFKPWRGNPAGGWGGTQNGIEAVPLHKLREAGLRMGVAAVEAVGG